MICCYGNIVQQLLPSRAAHFFTFAILISGIILLAGECKKDRIVPKWKYK